MEVGGNGVGDGVTGIGVGGVNFTDGGRGVCIFVVVKGVFACGGVVGTWEVGGFVGEDRSLIRAFYGCSEFNCIR